MFYSLSAIGNNVYYSLEQKLKHLIKGIVLYFISIIILSFLMIAVDEFIKEVMGHPSIMSLIKESKMRITTHYNIIALVIILPILEELFFRLALEPNRKNITVFVFIFSFMACYGGIYPQEINGYLVMTLLLSIVCSSLVFNLLKKSPKIELYLKNKQKIITIISILTFGLLHITNFTDLDWRLTIFYPVFVLPQILIGFFCSILRLKIGFIWGILFHSIVNLIATIL